MLLTRIVQIRFSLLGWCVPAVVGVRFTLGRPSITVVSGFIVNTFVAGAGTASPGGTSTSTAAVSTTAAAHATTHVRYLLRRRKVWQ